MNEYISREAAVDAGSLSDWYISSVGDESPVWTDEHIDELLNDFLVIPKDTPSADVQPVKYGRWIYGEDDNGNDGIFCSECEHFVPWFYEYYDKSDELIDDNPRCPHCGAKMDLKDGDIING